MGPIGCPETSVIQYRYTLRNISEESRSRLHRVGSVKLRMTSHSELFRDGLENLCFYKFYYF